MYISVPSEIAADVQASVLEGQQLSAEVALAVAPVPGVALLSNVFRVRLFLNAVKFVRKTNRELNHFIGDEQREVIRPFLGMKLTTSLLIVLSEPPTLSFRDDVRSGDIMVKGERFEDSGLGNFAGFHDWLRTSSGQVVGVRTWLLDNPGLERVRALIANGSAIELHDKEVRCFFSTERHFDDAQSDDQDFGVHRIAISTHGAVALTYDAGSLSETDLLSIKQQPWFTT